jgi:hypothetical protein
MPRTLAIALLCLTPALAANEKMTGTAGYEFLTADVDAHCVTRWGRDGQPRWVYDQVKAIDAWLLPGGDILMAYLPSGLTANKGGVRRVTADKQLKFDYAVADEVMSCQPLPDGHILVAECDTGRISEIDENGKFLSAFDLVNKGRGHQTVRQIRLTPQGTILVAECYTGLLREYDRAGKALAQWSLPMAFCAYRLPNGHVLISGYRPGHLREVDAAGQTVWDVAATDLPGDLKICQFGEAVRLANGNTLVACCSHGVKDQWTIAFEITPDKQVVWQLRDPGKAHEVAGIKMLP